MLNLYERQARVKSEREKRAFQSQIELVDVEINALVYGLYGLTSEEIAIVESEV